MQKKQQGFTLIELMIVVAIIGILAAIAIPAYQDYVSRSQVGRAVSEVSALKTATEEMLMRNEYPTTEDEIGFTGSNLTKSSLTVSFASNAGGLGYIQMNLDNDVAAGINGTNLQLQRAAAGGWTCEILNTASGWEDSYAPSGCTAVSSF